MVERYCYADKISNFLKLTSDEFINTVKTSFLNNHALELSDEQIHAWIDSFHVIQRMNLPSDIHIIFEYSLPYESGRRPDVILLSNEHVLILEFKMKGTIKEADVDQAKAYARDISEYHYESRDKQVVPMLVLTRTSNINQNIGGVHCVSSDNLQAALDEIYVGCVEACDYESWINSKYEPLPTIVDAARRIMNEEELPNIRKVNSTCIPQALASLNKLTEYAKENKKHVIAFVTGVPGAGKTYLGLQYVYNTKNANAICLSGNGPLVEVLTDALGSDVFVKEIHKVEREFLDYGAHDFNSNVLVFDEGQRAWDINRMQFKGRGDRSEADVMIQLCEERLDWCVFLILVGEGQEIYSGENEGIPLWNAAINNGNIAWEVACPPKLDQNFANHTLLDNIEREAFDLTVSLRSHLSGTVSKFINYIMNGEISEAAKLAGLIYDEGYDMYCTQDLEAAKEYCQDRYQEEPSKKYGILASSEGRGLFRFGVDNDYKYRENVSKAKWFNAPSDSPESCCSFNTVFTEFEVQGLELDLPIVAWGLDMIWQRENWKKFKPREDINSDANTYRRNSYRVLLTRGRDGFIVFVPPMKQLKKVYDVLLEAGIKEIN